MSNFLTISMSVESPFVIVSSGIMKVDCFLSHVADVDITLVGAFFAAESHKPPDNVCCWFYLPLLSKSILKLLKTIFSRVRSSKNATIAQRHVELVCCLELDYGVDFIFILKTEVPYTSAFKVPNFFEL